METKKVEKTITRRNFIGLTSGFIVATGLSKAKLFSSQEKKKADLFAPLSPEEQKKADNSRVSKYIDQFKKRRINCSENVFMIGLKYLNQPDEFANSAIAFGGGLGKGDICGLITGASMTFGIAAAHKYKDKRKIGELAGRMNHEYWNWFKSHAPIHCKDLRKQYKSAAEYHNMITRITIKLDEIFTKYQIEPKQ